jgi:hypothetical protein
MKICLQDLQWRSLKSAIGLIFFRRGPTLGERSGPSALPASRGLTRRHEAGNFRGRNFWREGHGPRCQRVVGVQYHIPADKLVKILR